MKKNIFNLRNVLVLVLMSTSLLIGCEGLYEEKEFTIYEQEEPEGTALPEVPKIGKKGVGLTTIGTSWSYRVSKLKVHWYYSWGINLSEYEPDNVDFAPMKWGKGSPSEEVMANLTALKEAGKINYLLGFNEPDGAEQANMTVQEAVDNWPALESLGLPLGSPGCVNPTGNWMKEFMQRATDEGLRVDFVCVHSYGGASAQSLLNKLEEVYNLYGKPIWITEFAVADWTAATPEENKFSPAQVLSFMQEILPALEDLGYVHRYAWFPFGQTSAAGTSSALFDADGNLTTLGEFYANFEPNTLIGPGKEPWVDPTIAFQDDFEEYAEGTSLTEKGYVVWEGSAKVAKGGAFEGSRFVKCDISKNNFAVRRSIILEAGKTYSFEVSTKMQDGAGYSIQVHPKAAYGDSWINASNADWQTHITQFTVTEGNEEVTIALYRWPKKELSFDQIFLKEVVE